MKLQLTTSSSLIFVILFLWLQNSYMGSLGDTKGQSRNRLHSLYKCCIRSKSEDGAVYTISTEIERNLRWALQVIFSYKKQSYTKQ